MNSSVNCSTTWALQLNNRDQGRYAQKSEKSQCARIGHYYCLLRLVVFDQSEVSGSGQFLAAGDHCFPDHSLFT